MSPIEVYQMIPFEENDNRRPRDHRDPENLTCVAELGSRGNMLQTIRDDEYMRGFFDKSGINAILNPHLYIFLDSWKQFHALLNGSIFLNFPPIVNF